MRSKAMVGLGLLLVVVLSGACITLGPTVRGSGQIVSADRPVAGSFSRVSLSGEGEVLLVQGEAESIRIEADDNIVPHIQTVVRDGVLDIGYEESGLGGPQYDPSRPPKYYVTMKTVEGLEVSGSGSMAAQSLRADRLQLEVSGSGAISIAGLFANALRSDISGSGAISLAGEVAEHEASVSGSGAYRAGDAVSKVARLELSGSGQMVVWVREALEVEVSGSGAVQYYGQPRVRQSSSGSGVLQSLGDRP